MPAAAFVTAMSSGHGPFPPVPSTAGASKTMIEKKPALNLGSAFMVHCNPSPSCHAGSLGAGSGKVMIEGKPAGRIGDAVGCGGVVVLGSGKVLIGG